MQDNNTDVTAQNDELAAEAQAAAEQKVQSLEEQLGNIPKKVAEKIKACDNILVALSNDPNVDEISAAIGLTMILDKLGKHATAIYSGETPNTLEFLKPDETFEKDTNSLQDFIIALNKEKADHLRYKIEGDYVKVYITPYKTTISQKDLEFEQGDFNVDLVISIDVDSAEVLDAALEEYGRIMHDATAINITTNQAGHFAELEWSDPSKSSVCEMIVNLCEHLEIGDFDQPIATALLTGIVSATERFSNARTTSETMQISSRLMQAGADQQLISSNIMQAAEEKPIEEKPVEEPAPVEEAPKEPAAPLDPLIPAPTLGQPVQQPSPMMLSAPAMPPMPAMPTMTAAPMAPVMSPEPTPVAPVAPAAPVASPTPEEQLEQAIAAPTAATGMPESIAAELANATPESEKPAESVAPEAPEAPAAPVAQPEPVIPEAPAQPEILVGTPSPVKKAPAPSLEPSGPEGLVAPTAINTEPVQQPASGTFGLPGQDNVANVPSAPAPTPETASALPKIVSQGSVMSQNVAEALPETPDYGAMIDQALSDAMNTPIAPIATAPANPAVQAAPVVPDVAPEVATMPTLELGPVPTAPTTAPVAPAAPAVPEATPIEPVAPSVPEAPAIPPVEPTAPVAPAAPTVPEAPVQPIDVPAASDIDIELPPPPAPNIAGGMPPTIAVAPDPVLAMPPTAPAAAPEASAAPTAPETPALDPSAFQIPQA